MKEDLMIAEMMGEPDRSLVYRRTFDAPRTVVWKAWTTPSNIAAWWGPAGFGNTITTMEVKAGGRWSFVMHGPDGTDYPNEVLYLEVEEPWKLVYDHGDEGRPDQFRVSVVFKESGAKTDMVYRMLFPSAEARRQVVEKYGAVEGLKQNMDRFEGWLEKTGLVLSRVFHAPRAAVWKAWTDPAQLQRWWGPEGFSCPAARVDLRVNGQYVLGMKQADGQVFWAAGVYKEVVLNEKLVYTDNFADSEGKSLDPTSMGLPADWKLDQLVTVTFADLGADKTLVIVNQQDLPEDWKQPTVESWGSMFNKLDKNLS